MEGERKRILIVDDEEDLVRSFARRLNTALRGVEVVGVTSPLLALGRIRAHEHALVITDVRMPELTGVELLLHARERWPSLPFVIMTAFPTESVRREAQTLGVHYVEKPFPIQALIKLVEEILEKQESPGFSGAVSSATLPDLIQLFFMSGSTGALRVWHGAESGAIWFDAGAIIHATAGQLVGRKAVFELVSWSGGKFAMDLNVAPPTRTVSEGTTGLVLEALRRADERRSGKPGVSQDIVVEGEALAESEFDFSEPIREPAGNPGSATLPSNESEPTDQPKGAVMPNNVQMSLEKLRNIDGYIGGCVVDSESAMSLGSDGGGAALNMDVAAAANAEVVKAKRKAIRALGLKDEIDDILISLGKQYHLIRPLRSRPGVFIYLALDRSRSNLAMARLSIADVEKGLEL